VLGIFCKQIGVCSCRLLSKYVKIYLRFFVCIMNEQNRHLLQDVVFLVVIISLSVVAVKTGLAEAFVLSLGVSQWLGIILAGVFFTSIFTTAPAIALLSTFAETTSLPLLALLGGLGAVLGDYIIFRLVKDRITKDFEYLLSFSKRKRFTLIFRTRTFKYFAPFLGALIIASPLPDEMGVAMLGASKIKDKYFFLLSFLANGAGILVIGWIARHIQI